MGLEVVPTKASLVFAGVFSVGAGRGGVVGSTPKVDYSNMYLGVAGFGEGKPVQWNMRAIIVGSCKKQAFCHLGHFHTAVQACLDGRIGAATVLWAFFSPFWPQPARSDRTCSYPTTD